MVLPSIIVTLRIKAFTCALEANTLSPTSVSSSQQVQGREEFWELSQAHPPNNALGTKQSEIRGDYVSQGTEKLLSTITFRTGMMLCIGDTQDLKGNTLHLNMLFRFLCTPKFC